MTTETMEPSVAQTDDGSASLTEHGLDHWGTYRDLYRVVDGCWRFQRRAVGIDGSAPGGWGERSLARLRAERP